MLIQINSGDREKIKSRFLSLMGTGSDLVNGAAIWPLPNLKPIAEGEFWGWRSIYSFKAEAHLLQFRAADRDSSPRNTFGHPKWSHAFVFLLDHGHYDGGGFAVLYTYNRRDWNTGRSYDADHPCVEYFSWRVCEHEFDHKSTGNCQHHYTCKKCGSAHDVDSSG
jgi:hypothetical protein